MEPVPNQVFSSEQLSRHEELIGWSTALAAQNRGWCRGAKRRNAKSSSKINSTRRKLHQPTRQLAQPLFVFPGGLGLDESYQRTGFLAETPIANDGSVQS
jgi:hypothetical protein